MEETHSTSETLWGEVETAAQVEAGEKAKRGSEEKAKSPAAPTAELIAPVVDMIAGIAPPPEISAAERKLLSQSAGDLIDHLFPGGLAAWGPWYTFALVWGAVFAPRIFAAGKATPKAGEPTPEPYEEGVTCEEGVIAGEKTEKTAQEQGLGLRKWT